MASKILEQWHFKPLSMSQLFAVLLLRRCFAMVKVIPHHKEITLHSLTEQHSPGLPDGAGAVEGRCRCASSAPLVGGGVRTLALIVFANSRSEGHAIIIGNLRAELGRLRKGKCCGLVIKLMHFINTIWSLPLEATIGINCHGNCN